MLPNDNVSMSVGHLDHVLIVYSSMDTDPSLQGKGEQCNSQVSHYRHAVEENHVIDWDKAKVVDREAQR